MKILQLCHKPPFPAVDGGTIAMHNIAHGLIGLGDQVKVIAMATHKHPVIESDLFDQYREQTQFESVFVDTSISKWDAIKALISGKSYHISRFDTHQFAEKLTQTLKEDSFDVIQMESIYLTPYIPVIRAHSKAKIVVRLHNIEHQIWERMIKNEKNILKKIALSMTTRLLKKYELSILNQVDGFMAISDVDYQYFRKKYPSVSGITIPFGVDLDQYQYAPLEIDTPKKNLHLFHIGSMNWAPNIEGIEWFLDRVWPVLLTHFPELEFYIAGRDIPEYFNQYEIAHFNVDGEVPDAQEYMLFKDIMIVPLLSGSGVRIKIIEGMALGKVIISTSIGAEGLDVVDGEDLFIADTPEQYVGAIKQCMSSPEKMKNMAKNARKYVESHHHDVTIAHEIIKFYHSL